MKHQFIGLCGLAGSGKSTAADYLVRHHGFLRLSYASPIKRMVRAMLIEAGAPFLDAVEMVDGKLKELPTPFLAGRTPRHAMQTLGTEWGRDLIAQDIWRRILLNKVSQNASERIVVDDVRFPNEVEGLRAEGFHIIRVVRASAHATGGHSSEAQDFEVDTVITNDGTVADLQASLLSL